MRGRKEVWNFVLAPGGFRGMLAVEFRSRAGDFVGCSLRIVTRRKNLAARTWRAKPDTGNLTPEFGERTNGTRHV